MTDRIGRISAHDSLNREPPPDATPEAIQAQIDAFKARGGKVQQLPMGVSGQGHKDPLRPDKPRGIATPEYASSRGRRPKQNSQIKLKGSKS